MAAISRRNETLAADAHAIRNAMWMCVVGCNGVVQVCVVCLNRPFKINIVCYVCFSAVKMFELLRFEH